MLQGCMLENVTDTMCMATTSCCLYFLFITLLQISLTIGWTFQHSAKHCCSLSTLWVLDAVHGFPSLCHALHPVGIFIEVEGCNQYPAIRIGA